MKGYLLAIILLFTLNPLSVTAQGTVNGCLITSSNVVYTDKEGFLINEVLKLLLGGNDSYAATSGVPLSSNYCSWTPTPTGTINCGVCTNYSLNVLGLVTGCQSGALLQGYAGTYTMVQCNLDDHSWVLGAAAGLFGLFIIKRRNKL